MAMDKDERNRRRRERYASLKDLGLSRNETRSLGKAVEAQPTLMDKIGGLFKRAAASKASTPTPPPTPTPAPGSRKPGRPPKEKPPALAPKAPRAKAAPRASTLANEEAFRDFTRANPGLTQRKLREAYRTQTGRSIGNDRSFEIIREERGAAKQTEKITRIKYRAWDKVPGGATRKKYLSNITKTRYHYIVKYEVTRQGFAQPSTEYMTIPSNTELSVSQVRQAVEEYIGDRERGQRRGEAGTKGEEIGGKGTGVFKYVIQELVPGSIEVLYAVDSEL